MRAPLLLGGVRLPVLLDGIVVEPTTGLSQHRRKALALDRVDNRLPRALRAKRLAETMPLAVGEEPGAAQREGADRPRVVARPPHADQTAPVVDYQRDLLELEVAAELLDRRDVVLPGARVR